MLIGQFLPQKGVKKEITNFDTKERSEKKIYSGFSTFFKANKITVLSITNRKKWRAFKSNN